MSTARAPSRRRTLWPGRAGHLFVAAYVVLLVAFGVVPTVSAIYFAFTDAGDRFAGLANFVDAAADFRYFSAVGHVALYLLCWLVSLVVFVVGLARLLHRLTSRAAGTTLRFLYYIPGALAGAASVMVWLFMLDPSVSPLSFLLRAFGFDTFGEVVAPGHLPVLFTMIAFWTGAGGWIVVLYGALNTICPDLLEAARIDGAGAWQTAWRVQLPLLRKWIVYMVILAFAGGTQLFVEPQLLSQASVGVAGRDYSLNQLSYDFAFQNNNVNTAAAISVELLVIGGSSSASSSLVHGHPLSFGSWGALGDNWTALTAFGDNAIFLWLGNSAVYSFLALAITLCVAVAAGARCSSRRWWSC